MELAKYKACICEGSAEEAIIDILVDNGSNGAYGKIKFNCDESDRKSVV